MAIITFDTCIVIANKLPYFPKGLRMAVVVLHELTVGAKDDSEVRYWEATRRDFEKRDKLLVPNGEDWFIAGKVLNSLQRGRKASNRGKTPKLSADESRRIMKDVLIARTAKPANALLVTDNVADVEKISFCSVRIVTGSEFFG